MVAEHGIKEIKIRPLGLAAYIRLRGGKLIRIENKRIFVLESYKTEEEWRVEYTNSECMMHDTYVCDLRDALKGE